MDATGMINKTDAKRRSPSIFSVAVVSLGEKNSAELANLIGNGNQNTVAHPFIKPEIAKNTAIFPYQATQAKLGMLTDMSGKQRRALNRIWMKICPS